MRANLNHKDNPSNIKGNVVLDQSLSKTRKRNKRRKFTNNITIVVQQLHIILTIQVKEKIHHIMINIIFNTHQSFIHIYLFITNYS